MKSDSGSATVRPRLEETHEKPLRQHVAMTWGGRACASCDDDGGPGQGPAPPIKPWWPVAWFVPTAIVLVVLVLGAPEQGPLDHADKAQQRTGLLIPYSEAPDVTALELPGRPGQDVPTVVAFHRTAPDPDRYRRWVQSLPQGTQTVLVLPGPPYPELHGTAVIGDSGRIAEALRMETPQDGGFPIGYAVIDGAGRLRYQTLDPKYLEHASEVATMAGAVQ